AKAGDPRDEAVRRHPANAMVARVGNVDAPIRCRYDGGRTVQPGLGRLAAVTAVPRHPGARHGRDDRRRHRGGAAACTVPLIEDPPERVVKVMLREAPTSNELPPGDLEYQA